MELTGVERTTRVTITMTLTELEALNRLVNLKTAYGHNVTAEELRAMNALNACYENACTRAES